MMLYAVILINVIIDVIVFYKLYKKLSDVNRNVSSRYFQTEFILRKMDAILDEWLRCQGKELKCINGHDYRIFPTSDKYYHESERKKELERRRTNEFIEGAYKTAEEIKKLLTDNLIKKEKEKMKCCKCGKKIEGHATYIRMENTTNKELNKVMAVCNDCAYGMISKGAEIDPILLKEN